MNSSNDNQCVTTALLLAAGTGSRLYPITKTSPKCFTLVNGISILERLVDSLRQRGFKRLIIVTGHQEMKIRKALGSRIYGMVVDYVFSPLYKTTNNIYSLWLVRKLINEPFLLIESDLVFDSSLLDDMLYPDRMAVALMQSNMNGSTVTVDDSQRVLKFQNGIERDSHKERYKTVNIYSFSRSSWNRIVKRLDQHIKARNVNAYYEIVLAELVDEGNLTLQAVSFDSKPWYEIDTLTDLAEAEILFADGEATTSIFKVTPAR